MEHSLIYLVHMFFVTPLFIYPFVVDKYLNVKSYDNYFLLMFIIGLVVFYVSGYKFYLINKY